MATNALGKNKKNLTATFEGADYVEVERLAGVSGVRASEYARTVLEWAARNGLLIRRNPDDYALWTESVKKGDPIPKIRLEVVVTRPLKAVYLPGASIPEPTAGGSGDILCPSPEKFPVQAIPDGPVSTRKRPGASTVFNEDPVKELTAKTHEDGPTTRSTKGVRRMAKRESIDGKKR